jgi:hypothetical protein
MRRISFVAPVILLFVPSTHAGDETSGNRSIHIALGSGLSHPVIELAAWVPEMGRLRQTLPETEDSYAVHRILWPGDPTDPQSEFTDHGPELGMQDAASVLPAGTKVHAASSGGGPAPESRDPIAGLDVSVEDGEQSPRNSGSFRETPWDAWEDRDSAFDGWDYRDNYDR